MIMYNDNVRRVRDPLNYFQATYEVVFFIIFLMRMSIRPCPFLIERVMTTVEFAYKLVFRVFLVDEIVSFIRVRTMAYGKWLVRTIGEP